MSGLRSVRGAASPRATERSASVTERPSAAASAARPRSPADGKRSSGALASARASTRSNSRGTPGTDDGGSATSCVCASIVAGTVARGNGGAPVSAA